MGNVKFTLVCILCVPFFFACRKEAISVAQSATNTALPPTVVYDESRILRAPGNYQLWNVPDAPQLVSAAGNGEYEGYINFSLDDTQFWLVRGTNWNNVTTYNETGNNTFGHNGDYFKLPQGAGIYKVNASTNNFTWSCKKINSWSLSGSAAAGADTDMTASSGTSWSVTCNLSAGTFVFRANRANEILFGHNPETPAGRPDYNGEPIRIDKAGNYTITLSLKAGNYGYGVRRN